MTIFRTHVQSAYSTVIYIVKFDGQFGLYIIMYAFNDNMTFLSCERQPGSSWAEVSIQ